MKMTFFHHAEDGIYVEACAGGGGVALRLLFGEYISFIHLTLIVLGNYYPTSRSYSNVNNDPACAPDQLSPKTSTNATPVPLFTPRTMAV